MEATTQEIVRWSASHWGAIIVTAVITAAIITGGRRLAPELRQKYCRLLAIVTGIIYLADSLFIIINRPHGSWELNLPLHFCSMMLLVAIIALWTRNRVASWVLYFGALTACLQGFITPALEADFPTPRYFLFFCLHGILMPAALAVPLIMRMRARFRDVVVSLLCMDIYVVIIHGVNHLLGTTNYGFTMESPVPGCILDYLGPAPWYYLLLQIPVLGLFSIMYLFVREKKQAEQ